MSSYKIIVARYNENIEWLNSEMANCIIYNKGNKLNIENEILLENLGRESETYLHYIISNYDNLPDVVVFSQARISDHIGSDNINFLIQLKNSALCESKSQNFMTHNDTGNSIHWDKSWNLRSDGYYLHLFTFQTPILLPIKIYNTFYYIFQNSGMFRNIN